MDDFSITTVRRQDYLYFIARPQENLEYIQPWLKYMQSERDSGDHPTQRVSTVPSIFHS